MAAVSTSSRFPLLATAFRGAMTPIIPSSIWKTAQPITASSLPAIWLNFPSLLSDLWDGLLRAVPKKKTSYSKKRHRQLAGKALKDVNNLKLCPVCGEPRRTHYLCQTCAEEIRKEWYEATKEAERKELAKTAGQS